MIALSRVSFVFLIRFRQRSHYGCQNSSFPFSVFLLRFCGKQFLREQLKTILNVRLLIARWTSSLLFVFCSVYLSKCPSHFFNPYVWLLAQ